MIAKLKGKITDIFEGFLIIEVGGVGYRVEIQTGGLAGEEIELYIHTHVRENELRLFGFKSASDLALFEKLISVSGVGPKSAMSLIDNLGGSSVKEAIATRNPAGLKTTGIGQKTAERIVIELTGKISQDKSKPIIGSTIRDAAEALVNLGYSQKEVDLVLRDSQINANMDSETIIKIALKLLK